MKHIIVHDTKGVTHIVNIDSIEAITMVISPYSAFDSAVIHLKNKRRKIFTIESFAEIQLKQMNAMLAYARTKFKG